MRRTLPFLFTAVSCIYAQKAAPSPGFVEVTPDTVIATVNGRKFTVADFERLLPALQPNQQQAIKSQPKAALADYAYIELLSQEAEKLGVETNPKVKEKLAEARRQVLAQALVERKNEDTKVPEADLRKYYDANLDALKEAQVRVIYVSRGNFTQNLSTGRTTSEEPTELKKKAETAAKLAREGKDFAELAKQYSDDKNSAAHGGALNIKIRQGANGLPKLLTDPVLKAEKGDIVGPVEHETGWYVFRIETTGVPEFEAARPDIEKQLKFERVKSWFESVRAKANVQLQNDDFWKTFLAANKAESAPAAAGTAQGGAK